MLIRKMLGFSLALGLGGSSLFGGLLGKSPTAEAHGNYYRGGSRVSFSVGQSFGQHPHFRTFHRENTDYNGGFNDYQRGYRNRGRQYYEPQAVVGRGCPTPQGRAPRGGYY